MSDNRWWETRWFALVAVLLTAMPLLWPTIPPLTDLPGHLGRYRVMLGTDADVLDQWYRFEWRLIGNLGIDLLVYALASLTGLELAVKLAMILTVALSACGILWVSREAHGRVTPFALFALPLVYNYAFHFGFVNYALAMALALNAFALWLRLGRAGRLRLRAALFVPIACLVWLAHIMGWGALGLMAFGAELIRQREQGRDWAEAAPRAALGCLPLALPLVPLLAWRSASGSGLSGRFLSFKFEWLAAVLRDRWMLFDIASATLLWALVHKGIRDRRLDRSATLTVVTVLFALAYLALPFMLFNSGYADMRLAAFVLIFALLASQAGERIGPRERRWLAIAGLAFLLVRSAGTTISFWQYDRSYQRQLAALDHVPRGARLVTLIQEHCVKPWAHSRLVHLAGIALDRRAAFANDQWRLDGSALLAITAPDMKDFIADPSQMVLASPCHLEPELETVGGALQTIPRDAFDYVWLVDPPAFDRRLLAGMTPIWQDGDNALYRIDKRLSDPIQPH